nr:MAG TPA: hypothetical protein [Caudoviricetes sp.]
MTFENKFLEKHRPTILQSYKLFFFSNLYYTYIPINQIVILLL